MNKKNMKIYYLCTEDNNNPVYIGSTGQDLKYRRENHLSDFRNPNKKTEWIKKEKNGGCGKHIKIVLLETCTKEDRYKRENYWINYYLNLGFELFNMNDALTTSNKQKEIARKTILKNMSNPKVKENIKKAILRRRKRIMINGVEYDGINEASRKIGVSADYICSMAKGKISKNYSVSYI